MIYDWIKNRNRFRVEVPDVEAAAALLDIIRLVATPDADETFVRDIDANNREFAVVYITPINSFERQKMKNILTRIDTITD